jgi:hypothetical protein
MFAIHDTALQYESSIAAGAFVDTVGAIYAIQT